MKPSLSYCTVKFLNGSQEFDKITVLKGQKVTRPITNPSRENYAFDDWYKVLNSDGSGFGEAFNFNENITQNTILLAAFIEESELTVRINYNSTYDQITVKDNHLINLSGYEIEGYNADYFYRQYNEVPLDLQFLGIVLDSESIVKIAACAANSFIDEWHHYLCLDKNFIEDNINFYYQVFGRPESFEIFCNDFFSKGIFKDELIIKVENNMVSEITLNCKNFPDAGQYFISYNNETGEYISYKQSDYYKFTGIIPSLQFENYKKLNYVFNIDVLYSKSIELGEEISVNEYGFYKFAVQTSGQYIICHSIKDLFSIIQVFENSLDGYLESADDFTGNITISLIAGQVYYFKCYLEGSIPYTFSIIEFF